MPLQQTGQGVLQLLRRRCSPTTEALEEPTAAVSGTNNVPLNSIRVPADTGVPYRRFRSPPRDKEQEEQAKTAPAPKKTFNPVISSDLGVAGKSPPSRTGGGYSPANGLFGNPSTKFSATAAGGRAGGWIPIFPDSGRQYRPNPFGGAGGHHRGSNVIGMHFFTAALRALEPRIDDDFIDRLNYYYSSTMIIMFAILVSAKQYVGHPIECWVPAQFTKAMEQYAENYCWIQNTYWVPFSDLIPNRWQDRERRQIGYYQWVPFILALQALLFYIPAVVWRTMNSHSGINPAAVLQLATDDHNIDPENRIRTVNVLSRYLDDTLRYQRDFGTKEKPIYLWTFIRIGKFYGAYVSLIFVFVKFLYCLNVLGQFFLLNRFLETSDYPLFGAHILWDLLNGVDWQHSGKFPRVTLCDFDIRVLGNLHRYTIQCVLVINMFTEKIFICLWLWLLFLCFTDFFGLLFWTITMATPSLRIKFVLKYLELTDAPPDPLKDAKHIRKFVLTFLRPDGVLMLRMIANHAGTILCTELVYSLWLRYRETLKLTVEPIKDDDHDETAKSSPQPSSSTVLEQKTRPPEKMAVFSNGGAKKIVGPPSETDSVDKQTDSKKDEDAQATTQQQQQQPWTSVPPIPLIGNHRPTMLTALAGGVGRGRFIPERPPSQTGAAGDGAASARPQAPSSTAAGAAAPLQEYSSAYV